MAEKQLTDDEIKQIRLLIDTFEFCNYCHNMVPNVIECDGHDSQGLYYSEVCPTCADKLSQ